MALVGSGNWLNGVDIAGNDKTEDVNGEGRLIEGLVCSDVDGICVWRASD